MISGYYSYYDSTEITQKKLFEKIKHILQYIVLGCMICTIWDVVKQKSITWMGEYIRFRTIVAFIGFNQLIYSSGHLWFLFALLYCYIIMILINKYHIYQIAYTSIPFLLICNLGIRIYSTIEEVNVPWCITRNFFLTGMPFILLGNLIHRYKKDKVDKISIHSTIIMVVFGNICTLIESGIWRIVSEIYLGSIIISIGIFLLTIKLEKGYFIWNRTLNIFSYMGSDLVFYIYIIHPLIGQVLNMRIIDFSLGIWKFWITALITFLISLVIGACMDKYKLLAKKLNNIIKIIKL